MLQCKFHPAYVPLKRCFLKKSEKRQGEISIVGAFKNATVAYKAGMLSLFRYIRRGRIEPLAG